MRTDRELLADYAATGDEAAFAELVTRHGRMVYRTCLRTLGDEHAAEDAAQAVFVVLVQKRRALRSEGELAAWLHRVAGNAAHLALRSRARRARHEEAAAMVRDPVQRAQPAADHAEALSALDRELDGLPAAQRQAVALRYLEGRSQEEAARVAGCPQGTLARRAQLGLERLRERLCQRGCVLAAPGLLALLGAEAKAAAPASLLPSILAASKLAAAGAAAGAAGTTATVLADGVLKMMFWMKVKIAAAAVAAVLVVGGVGGVGGTVAGKMFAGEPAGTKPVETGAQEQSLKCQVTALLPGGKVALNAGSEQGVRVGFEFEVTRDGQKVGTVKAVAVEAKSLTAELVSATGEIKVGDLAATRFREVAGPKPPEQPKEEWSQESNGLVASLRTRKTHFQPGEPMEFEIAVKNVSPNPVFVHGSPGKLSHWPWQPVFENQLSGFRWVRAQPSLTAMFLKPGEVATCALAVPAADQPAFTPMVSRPGEKRGPIPNGSYRVKAAYFGHSEPWKSGALETNSVEVQIGPAGDAVNGLKFTISADKLEAKAGDEINIDLAFENVSKEAMHILKFDYLTLDWELVAPDGESLLPAPTAMPGMMPPAAKDYPELQAGGRLSWRSKTISGNPPSVYVGPQANYRNVYLVKPGTYKLTAVYTLPGAPPGVAPGKVWAGTVRSNTLEIKLGGDFKAPAMPGKWPPAGIPGVTFAQEPARPAAGAPDEAAAVKLAREFLAAKGVTPVKLTAFSIPAPAAGWWLVEYTLAGGLAVSPGPCVYVEKKTGKVTEKAPPGMPARM